MAESNEIREEPAGPSVATAEQQPTSRVTALEELLHTVSSLMNEDNLRRLCNHYGYCTENRSFATALELFQFLEERNHWGCGTEQEKVKVLIERMKELGRHDIVKIVQTLKDQENTVAVRNVAPSSLIRVKVETTGQCQLQVNASGEYIVLLEGNIYKLATDIFREFGALPLLAIGGSVAAICYGLYKLGYNAGSFYCGCVEFDISTEPGKERTVRRRLENGTFLQELREEVKDIIEEHSDILGDLKDFTIISCKEILSNKEKEGYDEVKNVEMKDLPSISRGVNIVQGVEEKMLQEMGELRNMITSLNKKVDGIVETMQTSKDREFQHMKLPVPNNAREDLKQPELATITSDKEENVHVLKCDAKFYTDHMEKSDEAYPIQHCSPKAHVLILNNYEEFKWWSQQARKVAERDGELMEQLWKEFQCNVIVRENKTAEEMLESLVKFSKSDIHEKCDFCVVIIISHGGLVDGQNVVCGVDNKNIPTEDVVKLFHNSTDRPHLIGKPKLIFFQSSRKDSASPEATVSLTDTDEPTLQKEQAVYTDDSTPQEEQAVCTKKETVPEESDILVAYPTVKGIQAICNEAKGSWFINAIATVFSKKARTEHVVNMLTEVGNKVSQMEDGGNRQMSEFVSTLRKKLYLYPGFPKTIKATMEQFP